MMYKKSIVLFSLVFTLATLLVVPFGVLAVYPNAINVAGFQRATNNILTWVAYLFGAFAVIAFFYAGFMFLSANGDSAKLKLARSAVLWGVVGIVVGLIASGIVTVISSTIGTG